jgi:transposase-like protein
LGLQRVLGLGSYKTAWTVSHTLWRAMIRPGRERLRRVVEVDEIYWGREEDGANGRQTYTKAPIAVAAEAAGRKIGRIRLRHIADTSRKTLHGFIAEVIEPGSTVRTDGLPSYRELQGYLHRRQVQRRQPEAAGHLLPRAHRVISFLKRRLVGPDQGTIAHEYLQNYLDEFAFRFNRRASASRGKLFYRMAQQAMQVPPTTCDSLGRGNPPVGGVT